MICTVPKDADLDALRQDFKIGSKAYGAMKEEATNIKSMVLCSPKNYSIQVIKSLKAAFQMIKSHFFLTATHISYFTPSPYRKLTTRRASWLTRSSVGDSH